ncbi:hypothetical protein DL237_04050 [Pseudooceanicola sediminis]|uniref:HlyD family efflux transporter periplasmic adaptor subunit n=1 Tax=Pseudooceanicola sediminis TaxID=2211117 RepID=A0A399J3I9_9RHOB|nr:hypothetical protein [Pseudooceanicola sediminis]KAA2314260.1 hypothetical protein E0K93_11505 [Puniceibacterium sp. HSS470]RII39884.1 hypothetical protein DL237_04050 [Pseudooceanicola sediminis]|tara:strand:- start:21038 stop:22561 length:1524 start_codon:yes stop_codon:yes gene_type:complete
MRVISRLAVVLVLTCLAGWAAVVEGHRLYQHMQADTTGRPGGGASRAGGFRAPEVAVERTQVATVHPVIQAYGRLASRAEVTLRVPDAGTVADVSPALADGADVRAGSVLIQLDDTDARAALSLAQADLARAELALRDSVRQAATLEADSTPLVQVRDIRQEEVDRVNALVTKGRGLKTDLDTARLALISAQQALAANRSAQDDLVALREQQKLDIEDARRAVASAERTVSDQQIKAGITGTYHGSVPVVGERLASGAEPGAIIDMTSLSVQLDLTAQEIARVTAPQGGLMPLPVTLSAPGSDRRFEARLHHISLTDSTETISLRQVVAFVDPASCPCLLPGDFVAATIHEPALENVSMLPAEALTFDGELLVLGEGDTLEARQMQVLRRLGERVAVTPPADPVEYVAERTPQLGAGLVIAPQRTDGPDGTAGAAQSQPEAPTGPRPRGPVAMDGPAIKLEPERRAALIARLEASDQMPPRARERMLQMLQSDEVPEALVNRIEAQD